MVLENQFLSGVLLEYLLVPARVFSRGLPLQATIQDRHRSVLEIRTIVDLRAVIGRVGEFHIDGLLIEAAVHDLLLRLGLGGIKPGFQIRFAYPDTDTSYQFEYVDAFGNEGSLSVNLADYGITFAAPPAPYADETVPTVVVDVYAKRFNNYTAAGAFSKDTESEAVTDEFANIGYVQGYSLKVGATDYSSYKIVVLKTPPTSLTYSEAVSDTVAGVSISGNTITVSADLAADFTIAVVDNASGETAATADNFSCITIRAVDLKHWFDTTKLDTSTYSYA